MLGTSNFGCSEPALLPSPVHLIGYDIGTGRRRWDTPTSDDVLKVDSATGTSTEVGVLPGWTFGDDDTGIYQIGKNFVCVNENGVNPTPPVFAFGP